MVFGFGSKKSHWEYVPSISAPHHPGWRCLACASKDRWITDKIRACPDCGNVRGDEDKDGRRVWMGPTKAQRDAAEKREREERKKKEKNNKKKK
tara:strand:- start:3217 stop:3498 length:282 start_codon:yes stop_codon:yes gene_type:complete